MRFVDTATVGGRLSPWLAAAGILLLILTITVGLGGLLLVHPFLGFAAAAGVVAICIYLRYRNVGILTVFFLVPLGPLLWVTPDGLVSVQKLLIACLVAVWLVELLLLKDYTPLREFMLTRLNIWGLLFLGVFIIALPWCRKLDNAVLLMVRWMTHLVLLYFLVFTVRSVPFLRQCLLAVIAVGVLISCMAIWEHFTEKSILEVTGRQVQLIKGEETGELVSSKLKTIREYGDVAWARSMATFKGPNELGLFLVFVAGLVLFFLFRPSTTWLQRGLCAGALLLMLLALNYTGSRGALAGFLAMAGAFVLLYRFPFKVFLISVFSLAVIVFLATSDQGGDQWRGGLNWKTIRQDDRIQWFQMSIDMLCDYPVAGVGLGQFEPRYFEYRMSNVHKEISPPHNIFFQIAAENGFLGIFLLLFMLYAVLREIWQLRRRPWHEDHPILGITLIAVLVGVMTFSMTSNVLLDETFWTYISLVAIVSSIHARGPKKPQEEEFAEEPIVVILPRSSYRV